MIMDSQNLEQLKQEINNLINFKFQTILNVVSEQDGRINYLSRLLSDHVFTKEELARLEILKHCLTTHDDDNLDLLLSKTKYLADNLFT